MSMNELRMTMTCQITLDGCVMIFRATVIKQLDQASVWIQIEPLWN